MSNNLARARERLNASAKNSNRLQRQKGGNRRAKNNLQFPIEIGGTTGPRRAMLRKLDIGLIVRRTQADRQKLNSVADDPGREP